MQLSDVIGSSHVAGKYNFTDQDYINEGGDVLLEMGSRLIKLWFTPRPSRDYPFNCDWPEITSLVQLADTGYFRKVFEKPFTTYILEAFAPGVSHNLPEGLKPEDVDREEREFYEITKHLLTRYRGTGKTFILQNWESDWVLTDPKFTREPDPTAMRSMAEWINTRQDGVTRARNEVGMDGVTVAHAMEVNLVARAMDGKATATSHVVPHTHCDMYSYSAYDTIIFEPDRFAKALRHLRDNAPPSGMFGTNHIFVGEFGAPENEMDQGAIVRRTVEESLEFGAPYIVYWEVFCNEPNGDYEGRPTNDNCRGFWLIRPDGTKSPAYHYFEGLLTG